MTANIKKSIFSVIIDLFFIVIGSCVFAFSVAILLDPYNIVPGGVTGIAMLLNNIFPVLPLGMTVLAINIPLYLISWRKLGFKFLIYSIIGTLAVSFMIDIFIYLPISIEIEPLLAGVFGGLLLGAGLGIVFSRGASTGGSDIIAHMLKFPFPHIQIGKLILAFDGFVVIAAGFVFGSVNNMLYAIITLFIASRATDAIIYGMNIERMVFIISDNIPKIVKDIHDKLERGVTLLHGEGGYSGAPKKVLLCAIKSRQIMALKKIIKEADLNAFMIVTEAHEVLGEGFSEHGKLL